jgi:hypothetical protein
MFRWTRRLPNPAEIEDVESIPQGLGLGICVGENVWQATLLAGDTVATLWKACCERSGDPKAGGVSHVSPYLHDFANSEQRGRESSAGTPPPCQQPDYARPVRASGHAGEEACTEQSSEDGAECRENTSLSGPYWTKKGIAHSVQATERNGGDDGTRTRDLCRDRAAF